MSGPRQLRSAKKAPSTDSIVIFFVIGAILLGGPLVAVLTVGADYCNSSPSPGSSCRPNQIYRDVYSVFPFLMIIGGVIIAYNFKRISDSLLPKDEDSFEEEGKSQ